MTDHPESWPADAVERRPLADLVPYARNEWAGQLRRVGATDNHPKASGAKVAIRRWLLDAIGAGSAGVLDLYAGSGTMYRAAWRGAALYRGCDTKFFRDTRCAYVVDNRRLVRAIDLGPFNIFDLDAYGSPWGLVTVIAARRRLAAGETIALALTDGSMMRSRFGGVERSLADLAAVSASLPGAHRDWQRLTHSALAETARRMGGELLDLRAADQSARSMFYCGALIGRCAAGKKKPRKQKPPGHVAARPAAG